MNVVKVYNQLKTWPLGKNVFSFLFGVWAPYFLTIRPLVEDLRPGHACVSMKQRWAVQNHIKTVHAIAVCNLVEMAMGLVAEATIPPHLRWLPRGMDVQYLRKATGKLTATSDIDAAQFFVLPKYPGDVAVPVVIKNSEGVVVAKADVRLYISEKPKKDSK